VIFVAEIYEKGQVVIPKYLRDEFKMFPGTMVAFRRSGEGVLVMPASNAFEEMEKLRKEGANQPGEKTARLMRRLRKAREKEMLDVPGL